MTSIRWKRGLFIAIRGVLLVLLAVILQWRGPLARLEHVLYDLRVAYCQLFVPPPSDKLVHLDIDDNALQQIGRWPWSRDRTAEMLDELRLTEPKVLTMDILFSEPEGVRYDPNGKAIDQDKLLADAIGGIGSALVPLSLGFDDEGPMNEVQRRLLAMLAEDPERTEGDCVELLRSQGFNPPDLVEQVTRSFLSIRPQAIYERIWRELSALGTQAADSAVIKRKVLPREFAEDVLGLPSRLFDEQYERIGRERQMLRFTLPLPAGLPPVLHAGNQITPILPLAQASRYSGFVDYLPDSIEGTVRSVPLFAIYRGRLVPHMSLAAACAFLDVDIHDLRLTDHSVIIPRSPAPDIVIPLSTRPATTGPVGLLMEVPMFGRRGDWLSMYDYPDHRKPVQHISMYEVWQICLTRHRMMSNEGKADEMLFDVLRRLDPKAADDYKGAPPESRAQRRSELIHTTEDLAANPALGDPGLTEILKSYEPKLRDFVKQNDAFGQQIQNLRARLRAQLHGRAVFLGGSTTSTFDVKPTSLFYSCPGIVVHGAIFNAIMTGRMWRVMPPGVNLLVTIALGFVTVLLVSLLPPLRAFFASVLLAGGYLAFNGYYLFDYHRLIFAAAAPTVAIAIVWSGLTLTKFVTEIAERARITRRFRSYVDPSLVNWVLDHPHLARFDGEAREMSICFSDLAGFTPLMEELGERVIPVLAEYMGRMVPVIRANNGYVAQLLGDGIYFFFGAPEPDPCHAEHAVRAVLEMHAALDAFNLTLRQRGLAHQLGMRVGVSTGQVVIGDAGPPEASAYTALGSTTNLAARLESANKFFGTKTLITARTVELLNGMFLLRPIASLRVAGMKAGVLVYEPLCVLAAAAPNHHCIAEHTVRVVEAFHSGDFTTCAQAVEAMERECGSSNFTAQYRCLADANRSSPPLRFDGQIVLTEK